MSLQIITKIILIVVILAATISGIKYVLFNDIDIIKLLNPWSKTIPIKEKIVTVTPETFLVGAKLGWTGEEIIVVQNHSLKPIYSVWLKIWAVDHDIIADKFKFNFHSNETIFDANFNGMVSKRDLQGLFGEDLSRKRDSVYLLFLMLEARDTAPFKLSYDANEQIQFNVKVLSHQNKPPKLSTKDGRSAVNFTPPETIKVKSLFLKFVEDK
jgi:hypothetical protein